MSDAASDSFVNLVENGRLLFSVPRRDVRKWANYIDREVESRPGSTRVSVIREHISTLDEKSGPMTGIAGILVAGCAILGNALFGGSTHPTPWTIGFFVLTATATLLSGVYSMSALGVEWPEDGGVTGAAAFEFRLLQRLVYRARNHAWGLRSAQIATVAALMILSEFVERWASGFSA